MLNTCFLKRTLIQHLKKVSCLVETHEISNFIGSQRFRKYITFTADKFCFHIVQIITSSCFLTPSNDFSAINIYSYCMQL